MFPQPRDQQDGRIFVLDVREILEAADLRAGDRTSIIEFAPNSRFQRCSRSYYSG